MDFLQLVTQRQSDRSYNRQPVEPEKLERILECARLAPSACNAQPWHLIVVDDEDKRHDIAEAASSRALGMNHFSWQAPVHIVIVEEKPNFTSRAGGWIKKKHFPLMDIGIVAEHICLAAASEGLGSCMIGWFNETKVRHTLGVPDSKRIPLIITIGYTDQPTRKKLRKNTNEIITRNRY
jgi:nitroreductase